MCKEGKSRGRVGGAEVFQPQLRQGLPGFMCAEWQSQTQHTHTLKMESRDQSSDGQVGENERHLMDGGGVEWKRSNAGGFISPTDDDAQHEDRHFYDGRAERQT